MKTEKKHFITSKGGKFYEAPCLKVEQIEMEQGIAAGSAPSLQEEYEEGDDDNRTFSF
ncbi:hypothetical protein [Sphingobacterium sp. MYb388]|uniref:hypothetical protein n=1 Tax=Sphingobacterium sp. MYb388 TaxID=2745437 RepID=UPI00309869C1